MTWAVSPCTEAPSFLLVLHEESGREFYALLTPDATTLVSLWDEDLDCVWHRLAPVVRDAVVRDVLTCIDTHLKRKDT